jgi:ATP-dependent exoDNAse (exonuclease V) alpha subunit
VFLGVGGGAVINKLAVQVLFTNKNKRYIGVVPVDYEDNEDNFGDHGKLREDRVPTCASLTLYIGMRIVLTKNLNKASHFVNGMVAVVEGFSEDSGCVRVRTQTGRRLAIYKYTDDDVPKGRVTYYPLRVGYAGTIHKFQGAELEHITLWLDRKGCPAAAYVALSRVQYDKDYLIGGVVTTGHFVPAK